MWFWPSHWPADYAKTYKAPEWADGVATRILALAHQALTDPLKSLVAELDPDRGSPASTTAFVLTLGAQSEITPLDKSLLFAAAALVVIDDWQLVGSGDTWVTPDSTLAAFDAIESAIARGARDPSALATLSRVLDQLASHPPSARAVTTWLALDAALMAGIPPPGRLHWGSMGSSDPSVKSADWRWLWSNDAANAEFVRMAKAQGAHVIASWDQPADQLPEAIWGPEICGGPPLGLAECHQIEPEFLLVRLVYDERLALAQAAVALARWAVDHGSFPETLQALVPVYAGRVPLDPMSGRPLRYGGGLVWSVGPDRDDDGGRALDERSRFGHWDGKRLSVPDGDEVWSLLPRRRTDHR